MEAIRPHTFDIARSKYSLASSSICFSNRTRPIKTKARTYSGSLSSASLYMGVNNALQHQPKIKVKIRYIRSLLFNFLPFQLSPLTRKKLDRITYFNKGIAFSLSLLDRNGTASCKQINLLVGVKFLEPIWF